MRAVLTFALAAQLAACSFGVQRAPATLNVDAPPKCTTSMARPGLDLAVAGVATLGALAADDGGRGVLLGTGALFGISGLLGTYWVNDCRRKVAAHEAPQPLTATSPIPEAAPEAEPEPEPTRELEARVDIAPDSGTEPAGTENQRCGAGLRCDLGLYCDLDRRICLPGDLGLEGGACQPGQRCAAGLVCRSGLCVRSTSAGSIRRPGAPRPSPGGEPPPSDRP